MNIGRVAGGTHAGWRRLREPREPEWDHWCDGPPHVTQLSKLPASYLHCPSCGKKRPNG